MAEKKEIEKATPKKKEAAHDNIVVYHNDLSDLPLTGFTANEQDFFMAVCLMCKNKGTDKVSITFDDAKELMQYKRSKKRFAEFLVKLNLKFFEITVIKKELRATEGYKLFQAFRVDEENETITMQISDPMKYILTVDTNFTSFQYSEFRQIKSTYAKGCYRQLERYRDTGMWISDIHNFRRMLGYPSEEVEDAKRLTKRVIPAMKEELSQMFEDLEFIPKYGKGRGNPIEAFEVRFKPQPHKLLAEEKKGFICPKCGEPLIEKEINGNNCWCHADGWKLGAKCNMIYNSVAEIKGYKETPVSDDVNEENVEKINACISDLFC